VERDLAVIIYTSGTTGHPKGAMLSHGNLLHNLESCRQVLRAVSYDRFVVLLPMFHSFMLTVGILLPLNLGGSMVLIKALHSPKSILNEAVGREATILPPSAVFPGSGSCRSSRTFFTPAVHQRGCTVTGEILKEFNARYPIPLLEGYGLSEASPVVSFNPIQGLWKPGSIGLPVWDVEMSVQNEAGEQLPAGQVGEICVRGGNVMQGYWKQPEETARALRQGWLLTGDVGYRDDDGYYYITDRKKDMLLVNGINVYPREIEEVIYQFPGVKEVAVIGIPDARKGEQPLAFRLSTRTRPDRRASITLFHQDALSGLQSPSARRLSPATPTQRDRKDSQAGSPATAALRCLGYFQRPPHSYNGRSQRSLLSLYRAKKTPDVLPEWFI